MPQGHTKLPDYVAVGQFPRTPLRDLFTAASADTLNLLSKCIIYEPRKRISARDVRNNPLFSVPAARARVDTPFVCRPSTTLTSSHSPTQPIPRNFPKPRRRPPLLPDRSTK